MAFNAYLERERKKAARIVVHLSDQGKATYLKTFDDPKRRLEMFERWLEREGNFVVAQDGNKSHTLADVTEKETCFKAQVSKKAYF